MAITSPTKVSVADWSGDNASTFTKYIDQACKQAVLLFKYGTCLKDMPTDPDELELAENALNELAYAMYNERKYRKIKANPFSSETIGSYSYTKLSQAVAAKQGTGLTWFDLARDELSVCDSGAIDGGSIHAFEDDGVFDVTIAGYPNLLGPADLDRTTPQYDTIHARRVDQ